MSEPVFGLYGPSREMEHPPLGHKRFPDRSLVLIERMIHPYGAVFFGIMALFSKQTSGAVGSLIQLRVSLVSKF